MGKLIKYLLLLAVIVFVIFQIQGCLEKRTRETNTMLQEISKAAWYEIYIPRKIQNWSDKFKPELLIETLISEANERITINVRYNENGKTFSETAKEFYTEHMEKIVNQILEKDEWNTFSIEMKYI